MTRSSTNATPTIPTGAASLHAALAALRRLTHDDSGQDIIEYALIAASLGLASIAGVHGLAASVTSYLNIVEAGFNKAVGPSL